LWDDIHSAAASLGRDLSNFKAIGKGTSRFVAKATYDAKGQYGHIREDRVATYVQRYRIAAEVRIDNPHTLLWQSLGLTDPVSVAYEVIPFSFVLNYFISLEEFIKGLQPWMGLTLVNAHTTHFTTVETQLTGHVVWVTPGIYPNGGDYGVLFNGRLIERTPGSIPGPPLRLRDPWILQPGRAVNAVALLLQQIRPFRT
jgi:hypothetical protein